MLLSKGLSFNTYQQTQPIRASANQSSVNLPHALAGADERRKVSPLCKVKSKSSAGYVSQLTRMWLNISFLCKLLCPQACQGQHDRQTCAARNQHACSGAPRKIQPWDHLKNHPHGMGMSFCLRRGELQEESFLNTEAVFLKCWEEPTEIAPDGMLPFLL